jgi:mono/diheme cytochrome c family protein
MKNLKRPRIPTVRASGSNCKGFAVLAGLIVLFSSCRLDMHDQPKYESYEASEFFANGSASRIPPKGTIPRGGLRQGELLYTGKIDGKDSELFPFSINQDLLVRGQERYNIYCSPCHDKVGTGRGIIVRRGMKQPPSFHIARLREAPPGYLFDVMTKGFGTMYAYSSRVGPRDRWAIAAYIRALQLSQNASYGDVSEQDLAKLEEATTE